MKEKLKAYLKGMKREQIVVYVLLIILLVVIVLPVKKKDSKTGQEKEAVENNSGENGNSGNSQVEVMEQQLENALSKVEGVGQVQVVITLESTNQKIVEKDRPSSESTQNQTGEDGKNSTSSSGNTEESTVYEKDSDGNQMPYVVSESYPEVRGVMVIAQGGDNPVVIQQISEGVMALFRVDAHKIKVMKMK